MNFALMVCKVSLKVRPRANLHVQQSRHPMKVRHTTLLCLCNFLVLSVLSAHCEETVMKKVSQIMNAEEAQANRFNGTVAIFYNPITQVDSREWDSIKEFNGPYHPLIGDYKCDDLAVLRKQLHWMRRSGVDVIVYDIYGFKTWNILDISKDKTLPLLINELANQDNESRKLKLVIWLEKWSVSPTLEEYQFGLKYVRENLATRDFYYHYKGAPLVLAYNPGKEYDQIVKENPSIRLERINASPTTDWSYVENYPQTSNPEWMPVNPGFDQYLENAYISKYVHLVKDMDVEVIRQHGPEAAALREDGRLFERQLLRAREVSPEIIFISGWNDWQCSLQIEPAVEYKFKYVDMAARLIGRSTETLPYRQP
jgi:hypothetical protein